MADFLAVSISRPTVVEGSVFTATANFRLAGAASIPTTARYRVDDDCSELKAWTTLTPAAAISFTVPVAATAIRDTSARRELRFLTIEADAGLSTQLRESIAFEVTNVNGSY